MGKIYKSIAELVGNTPLVELTNYEKEQGLKANIYGKLEYFNPSGSIKDRAALNMILKAEKEGKLKPGDTIVENTSGNTGIGLAAFAAARGYKLKLILEPGQSIERQQIFKAYGVDVKLYTDFPEFNEAMANGTFNLPFFYDMLQRYADTEPNHFFINQLVNDANPDAHYTTTGPEIWNDTDGKVDILVGLCGTGGTINGTGRYLKEKNPDLKIYVAQPSADSVKTPENPDANTIDGVVFFKDAPKDGITEFIQEIPYEECFEIPADDAYATGRALLRSDGIFLGQSASAALNAATIIAKRPENEGKNIVVMMADNGFKYLSTNMYKVED